MLARVKLCQELSIRKYMNPYLWFTKFLLIYLPLYGSEFYTSMYFSFFFCINSSISLIHCPVVLYASLAVSNMCRHGYYCTESGSSVTVISSPLWPLCRSRIFSYWWCNNGRRVSIFFCISLVITEEQVILPS